MSPAKTPAQKGKPWRWIADNERARIVTIVLLVAGLALIFVLRGYSVDRAAVGRDAEREVRHFAEALSDETEHRMAEAHNVLSTLAEYPPAQDDGVACHDLLARVAKQTRSLKLGLFNASEGVFCTSDRPVGLAGMRELEQIDGGLAAGTGRGSFLRINANGRYRLVLTRAVTGRGETPPVILYAVVTFEWLDDFLASVALPPGFELSLLDSKSEVIAQAPPSGDRRSVVTRTLDSPFFAEFIKNDVDGPRSGSFRHNNNLSGYARLPDHPASEQLYAAVSGSAPKMFDHAEKALVREVAILSGATGLVLAVEWVAASRSRRQRDAIVQETMDRLHLDISSRDATMQRGQGDMNQLSQAFERMATLVEARQQEAEGARSELNQMAQRILLVQEEERSRVSYDIHDGLLQMIVAADMHVEAFRGRARLSPAQEEALDVASEKLKGAIWEGRRIVSFLRPTVLDDFGLPGAVQRLAHDLRRSEGWQLDVVDEFGDARLDPLLETTLFRIIQEALNNARKHSLTRQVRIHLELRKECAYVEVRDWGQGFSRAELLNTSQDRLGLVSMRERARLIGGWCDIESIQGMGTTVSAVVPLGPAVVAPAEEPSHVN